MLKIAIGSNKVLEKISRIPFFRNFFVFKLTALNGSSLNISDALYRFIPTTNRTSKETAVNRFSDLDELAIKYIVDGVALHDVAVSSGVSSVEFFDEITKHGKSIQFNVSDKFLEVSITRGFLNKIIDSDGDLMGVYCLGLYASDKLPAKYFLSKFLFYILCGLKTSDLVKEKYESDKILLCSSQLNKYIGSGKIKRIEYDVFFTKLPNKFGYIRCMNLLNLSYFDRNQLNNAVNNILLSLQEGGIFQIGRTHFDGTNHAGFYIKENNKMKLLVKINTGSEIDDFILSWQMH